MILDKSQTHKNGNFVKIVQTCIWKSVNLFECLEFNAQHYDTHTKKKHFYKEVSLVFLYLSLSIESIQLI